MIVDEDVLEFSTKNEEDENQTLHDESLHEEPSEAATQQAEENLNADEKLRSGGKPGRVTLLELDDVPKVTLDVESTSVINQSPVQLAVLNRNLPQNLSLLKMGENLQKMKRQTLELEEEYQRILTKKRIADMLEKKTKQILEDGAEVRESKLQPSVLPSIRITEIENRCSKTDIQGISTAGQKISDRVHTVISGRKLQNDDDFLKNFDFKPKRKKEVEEESADVGKDEKVFKKVTSRDVKIEMKRKYAAEKEISKLAVS